MKNSKKIAARVATVGVVTAAWIMIAAGCVVAEPRDGYYDHPHHRYYHEHNWHSCVERDEHCR